MELNTSIFFNKKKNKLNILWQGSIFLIALLSVNAILFIVDTRTLADEHLWSKPLKFEISIIVHFITLAFLATLLKSEQREGNAWQKWSYIAVFAGLFEAIYIFLQAARVRESHFNLTTQFEANMYALMGLGAVTLVATSFYLGLKLYRQYRHKRNDPLLLSSALGLMIGSILTLIIAGYLSSSGVGESGKYIDNGVRAPFTGWYLNGQDLRIPHFFATHMMQIIPLYGLWLARTEAGDTKLWQVKISVAIYSILVLGLFVVSFI